MSQAIAYPSGKEMLSVAVLQPNKIDLVEIPEPEPGPYEARVKVEVSFICNATDRKLIEGHFPGVEKYPLLLGHESVGIVDKIGELSDAIDAASGAINIKDDAFNGIIIQSSCDL